MDKVTLRKMTKSARLEEKYKLILLHCRNKKVLDVGCIGQDVHSQTDRWLHASIKKVAADLTGVDISLENIEKYEEQGFSILHPSALATNNKLYDVIVMADVIEHVSNPQEFLEFYAQFLNQEGIILISTPNANRAINFLSILAYNQYSVNEEHTFWFCPLTLLEIVHRAHLRLNAFYWLGRYYNLKGLGFLTQLITLASDFFAWCRKNLSQNFMFIVSK